jgi:hypothetical protein
MSKLFRAEALRPRRARNHPKRDGFREEKQ